MKDPYSPSRDTVKVCKRNNCIEANGKNADLIAGAAALMLVCIGISAIANAIR